MTDNGYCTLDDPEIPCTGEHNAHVVCWRRHGGTLLDPFELRSRPSKALDHFWATGEAEVFDRQKEAATMARRDRVTSVEHVWHD